MASGGASKRRNHRQRWVSCACVFAGMLAGSLANGVVNAQQPTTEAPATEAAATEAPAVPAAAAAPTEPAEPAATAQSQHIAYVLERIDIHSGRTLDSVIRAFVPLNAGDVLDVDDPAIEQIRYRLLGTGWFSDVRLRLTRGSHRGAVVLVIEVEERNTLVIDRVVAGLARVVDKSSTQEAELRPYAGLGVSEHNLFGLGIGVSGAALFSERQFGLEAGYQNSSVLGTRFGLSGRLFHNHAREFFGKDTVVSGGCPKEDPSMEPEPCDPDVLGKNAVVIYNRTGFGFGTGHDITNTLRYSLSWQGERVDVLNKPDAAATLRGSEIVPVDFHIEYGISLISSLAVGLHWDRRDHPVTPTEGQLLDFDTRFSSGILGSDYDFARVEARFRQYYLLPWHHVLSVGAMAGTVFGQAPFFYYFYAADLSDLLPSRVLELNLDHRRTHNLLGTAIGEMDQEELAARVDVTYALPLHRGDGFFRAVDAYTGGGFFMLSRREDLSVAIPGYEGLSRAPVDLTFDIGFNADTEIGVFKIGFSSLIGFLPSLGSGGE